MELVRAARTARIHRPGVVEEHAGDGGALADVVDTAGARGVAALFTDDAERVELIDDTVSVDVVRRGQEARVTVRWASGESAEHVVPLPRVGLVTDLAAALHDPSLPLHYADGAWAAGLPTGPAEVVIPAIAPESLGSAGFREAHGVRYAYIAGAMAGGIGSTAIVTAMARAGAIGFFGAGGLGLDAVRAAVDEVKEAIPGQPAGFNLLHNPVEAGVEEATVDLYLERGIRTISASAFVGLTPSVVRFRLAGIHEANGRIVTPNRVLAKVSRPEVGEPFLRPAPAAMIAALVDKGVLTARQGELARRVPIAEDVTAEADSGGHTDRRPLSVLVPLFGRLRDRVALEERYADHGVTLPRIGAAGGLGDPWSVAAALQLGADYVLTGSVNQATVEAGTSDAVKTLLADAGYADVQQGPAPDMFEMGAQVQVLSRGSMYAQRAARLYDLYKTYPAIDFIPSDQRERVEKSIFQRSFDEVWAETERYWKARDPRELDKAARDSRHKMALCFRWYLGLTSRWARQGEAARKRDFQIWCGPAMGLFNDWVKGSWLEPLPARTVTSVAHALLHGACVALRVGMVRSAGLALPPGATRIAPHQAA